MIVETSFRAEPFNPDPALIAELSKQIPSIGQELYLRNHDHGADAVSAAQALELLDTPEEHSPLWHQYGISDHSIRALTAYDTQLPTILQEWKLEEAVADHFSKTVDGTPKSELFRLGTLFHDIGKYVVRTPKYHEGSPVFTFKGHAGASEEFILSDDFQNLFPDPDRRPTLAQVQYIARCAGLHFEVGKLRARAMQGTPAEFNFNFTRSDAFKNGCLGRLRKYPGFGPEMGVLFLADNISKIDMVLSCETDEELAAIADQVTQDVVRRNMNPALVTGVLQLPINVSAARQFLHVWQNSLNAQGTKDV